MKFYHRMSFKIAFLTAISVIIAVVAFVLVFRAEQGELSKDVQKITSSSNNDAMRVLANSIYSFVKIYSEEVNQELGVAMLSLDKSLQNAGVVHLEISGKNGSVDSALYAGKTRLSRNVNPNVPSPFVDEIMKEQSIYATVFRRVNENGTMVREITNIVRDGKRLAGTAIEAKNADGSQNKVIQEVLAGRTYLGRAMVAGVWVTTMYKPILENGKVIGMLFVGDLVEGAQEFAKKVRELRFGTEGRNFIVNGADGYFTASTTGNRDGMIVWNDTNSLGKKYYQDIISFAKSLQKDSVGMMELLYRNSRGEETLQTLAAVYFQEWDWVIGIMLPKEQAEIAGTQINKGFDNMRSMLYSIGVAIVAVMALVAFLIARSMAKPLVAAVKTIGEISDGNLTLRLETSAKGEIGVMSASFNSLIDNIHSFFKGMSNAAAHLTNQSRKLANSAKKLSEDAEGTSENSDNVEEKVEDMTKAIEEMDEFAQQSSKNAIDVSATAEEMSVNMRTITESMEQIAESISSISQNTENVRGIASNAVEKSDEATNSMNKLGVAAKEIGQVTDVIKKIADKTNLLALNATIEAASAGEAGKGFAVVASEIKELANQSAISADDIARRIESIQSGTNNAVTVIRNVSDIIGKINNSVNEIAGEARKGSEHSVSVSTNVNEAFMGTKNVASAIGEVARSSEGVAKTARESVKVAKTVNDSLFEVKNSILRSEVRSEAINYAEIQLADLEKEIRSAVEKFKV